MLYNGEIKTVVLNALENRVLSITGVICNLLDNGYILNKSKFQKVQVYFMLIEAFKNIDVLDKERQAKLENIYNKVI